MKKKIFLLLFTAITFISLTSCSKAPNTSTSSSKPTESTEELSSMNSTSLSMTTESSSIKENETTSFSENVPQETTTEETNSSNKNLQSNHSLPKEIQGTWTGKLYDDKPTEYIITENQIQTDGKIIDVTNYTKENNNYIITWDLDKFKEKNGYTPQGPQPFYFTYDPSEDVLKITDTTVVLNRS